MDFILFSGKFIDKIETQIIIKKQLGKGILDDMGPLNKCTSAVFYTLFLSF